MEKTQPEKVTQAPEKAAAPEKATPETKTEPVAKKAPAEGKVHTLERIIKELLSVHHRNSERLAEEGRPAFKPKLNTAEQAEVDRIGS